LKFYQLFLKNWLWKFGKNFTMNKNFSVPNSFHDLFAVTKKSVVKNSRSNSKNLSLLRKFEGILDLRKNVDEKRFESECKRKFQPTRYQHKCF
jgi:hypothetical protein